MQINGLRQVAAAHTAQANDRTKPVECIRSSKQKPNEERGRQNDRAGGSS
jgi:hypothetical protein